MSEINFDREKLLQEAQNKTGLQDFGDTDFMEGLGVLLQTYDHNGFTEKGRYKNRKRVLDLLCARLRIENAFKLHPEIRDPGNHTLDIKAPMFLTGLPRTGTSALLNLLALDPATRPLYMWEGFNPEPIEGLPKGAPDPRYTAMKAWEEENAKNTNFKKIHSTSVDTPEECIHLLNHTFCDVQYGAETMMEPYGSWFQKQDLHKSYLYYADLLRMLQWQRPGERWLLKTPGHLWALDILIKLFPDCSIIITHRNPLECVTSYASMMAALMSNREFDKRQLGPVVMEYLARKMEKAIAIRKQSDAKRFIDIQFEDFIEQPLQTAERIYARFHMPMSVDVTRRMKSYADSHPMGKHGKHEYQLEEYGLSVERILERFDFYIREYQPRM
jgi:hypothetical protein